MDWLETMGAYYTAFPDTPALAVDLGLYGPPADQVGYGLAYSALRTPATIDLYPPEEPAYG